MHKQKNPAHRAIWAGSSLQDVDLDVLHSIAFPLGVHSSARWILLLISGCVSWAQSRVGIEVLITPIHRLAPLVPCNSGPFFYNYRESTGQVPASANKRTIWKGDLNSSLKAQRQIRSKHCNLVALLSSFCYIGATAPSEHAIKLSPNWSGATDFNVLSTLKTSINPFNCCHRRDFFPGLRLVGVYP